MHVNFTSSFLNHLKTDADCFTPKALVLRKTLGCCVSKMYFNLLIFMKRQLLFVFVLKDFFYFPCIWRYALKFSRILSLTAKKTWKCFHPKPHIQNVVIQLSIKNLRQKKKNTNNFGTTSLDLSTFDLNTFDLATFNRFYYYRHWLGDIRSIRYHWIERYSGDLNSKLLVKRSIPLASLTWGILFSLQLATFES